VNIKKIITTIVKNYEQQMTKKTAVLSILIFFLSVLAVHAQSMDCQSILNYRKLSFSYKNNSLSKSAVCSSGKTYEFVTALNPDNEYRFSFFASSVFNHKINFKIIDIGTNELILDLKGESEDSDTGTCALRSYFNDKENKLVHPHFDMYPQKQTNIKIIVEIPSVNNAEQSNSIYQKGSEIQGCVSIFIQDKKVDDRGFN
jgi:hypothetical protein